MKIDGAGIADIQQYSSTTNQTTVDAETKSFQTQIASAQTQLQKLSANREMSSEEKAEKRQEIQKQIIELNNMLREHKMEMRREKQQQAAQEAAKSNEKQKGQSQESKESKGEASETVVVEEKPQITETSGMSSKHIKSIIAADSTVSRVKSQENISRNLESRVRVLEGEIKQAENNGGYVEAKKNEIESLENKVERISGAKMNILNGAMKEIKQVAEQEDRNDAKSGNGKNSVIKEAAQLPTKDFAKKKQVDMYTKGKTFSNVDIHF